MCSSPPPPKKKKDLSPLGCRLIIHTGCSMNDELCEDSYVQRPADPCSPPFFRMHLRLGEFFLTSITFFFCRRVANLIALYNVIPRSSSSYALFCLLITRNESRTVCELMVLLRPEALSNGMPREL